MERVTEESVADPNRAVDNEWGWLPTGFFVPGVGFTVNLDWGFL